MGGRFGSEGERAAMIRWAIGALALCCIMVPSAQADAQELELEPESLEGEEPEGILVDEPAVRRKLLLRSTRLEVAPQVAFTLNDAFTQSMLAGATVYYHLTNELAIGVTGGYSVLQFDTDLRENVIAALEGARDTDVLQSLTFSYVEWIAEPELSYVPMFGKFAFIGGATVNWDLHLNVGVGFIQRAAVNPTAGGIVAPNLSGLSIGPAIGLGARFFLGDMFSINLDVRDYIYSRAEVSDGVGSISDDLHNNLVAGISIGIFIPGEVKISR